MTGPESEDTTGNPPFDVQFPMPFRLPSPDAGDALSKMSWSVPDRTASRPRAGQADHGGPASTTWLGAVPPQYDGGAAPTSTMVNSGWTTASVVDVMLGTFVRRYTLGRRPAAERGVTVDLPVIERSVSELPVVDVMFHEGRVVRSRRTVSNLLFFLMAWLVKCAFRFWLGELGPEAGEPRGPVLSPRLTAAAILLVGQKRREEVSQEWRGHLLGEPGHDLTQRQQLRAALGFLRTALILRRRDAADFAWRPVDAVLRSRTKSNLFVLVPTVLAALYIFRCEGTLGVLKSAEAVDAIILMFYGLIRVGRWYRRVKPPKPRAWSTRR